MEQTDKVTTGISLSETEKVKFDGMKTKSERIRYLASLGHKNSAIAKFLTVVYGKQVLYQHVRNVLHQKLKAASRTIGFSEKTARTFPVSGTTRS